MTNVLPERLSAHGSCAKPENSHIEFCPDKGISPRPAVEVCRTCPVAGDCLLWALDQPEGLIGVYSGFVFPGHGTRKRLRTKLTTDRFRTRK